jgi:type II secretion system protein H
MERTAGFTLVEVLVVIALLGLVATLAIPLFHTDTPQQVMQQSCDRLSSLMAMCRAQAMLNGHPVRLTWQAPQDDPKGQPSPVVVHEADPIQSPGEFKPMAASWANDPVIQKNVQVRLVQLGDYDPASLTNTEGQFDLPAEPSLQPVEFHPDGTADPAVFVLTTKLPQGSSQEELQGWVVLDSVSGLGKVTKPPTADEFDAEIKELADLPDLQFQENDIQVTLTTSTNPMAALVGQSSMTMEDVTAFMESQFGSAGNAGAASAGAAKSNPVASAGAGGSRTGTSGTAVGNAPANRSASGGRNTGSTSGTGAGGSGGGRTAGQPSGTGSSSSGGGRAAGQPTGTGLSGGGSGGATDEPDTNSPGSGAGASGGNTGGGSGTGGRGATGGTGRAAGRTQ